MQLHPLASVPISFFALLSVVVPEMRANALLLALWLLFLSGSLTLIWPWEGSYYPSGSCNGCNRPKGPKFKEKKRLRKGEPAKRLLGSEAR